MQSSSPPKMLPTLLKWSSLKDRLLEDRSATNKKIPQCAEKDLTRLRKRAPPGQKPPHTNYHVR